MKIRLVQLDGKMPNIALMKISTYHKQLGHDVEWYNHIIDGNNVDKMYISKLFDFTPEYKHIPEGVEVVKGGTGYDISSKLPEDIDVIRKLDYDLYPFHKYSMQMFSRGCIRKCPFCIVPEKEGYIHPHEPFELNPNGKHIEVLDNNFFANPNWKQAAEYLIKLKQPVNLHGVDVRIMDAEQAFYLNKMRHKKKIHIAWDNPRHDLRPQLKEMIKYVKPSKIMCYVLIGYWSTPEEDMYRVEELRKLGIDPYVARYDSNDQYQKDFAKWVNVKPIFKTVQWSDFQRNYKGE